MDHTNFGSMTLDQIVLRGAYSVHVSVFCKFHYTNLDELVKIKSDELKRMIINYILELKK
jgi:hypothetical protein